MLITGRVYFRTKPNIISGSVTMNPTSEDFLTDTYNTTSSTISVEQCIRDTDGNRTAIVVYEIATVLICAFCVVGNSIVLYVVHKSPELVHPMNYFIFSLAISDITQGVTFPVYTFAHNYEAIMTFVGKWYDIHVCVLIITYCIVLFMKCTWIGIIN